MRLDEIGHYHDDNSLQIRRKRSQKRSVEPTLAQSPMPPIDSETDTISRSTGEKTLRSILAKSQDRTFPTARPKNYVSSVRFARRKPTVHTYELSDSDHEQTKKPLHLGRRRRQVLVTEELVKRLQEPDTLGMSDAQRILVSP